MKPKKLVLGIIIFTLLFALFIWFAWAQANFELNEDIWGAFRKNLIPFLTGPVIILLITIRENFKKRKKKLNNNQVK